MLALRGGSVDLRTGRGVLGGEPLSLGTLELALLRTLVAHDGPVARPDLIASIWNEPPTSRALDALVRQVRIKLEREPGTPYQLLTVHGEGYRWLPLERPPQTSRLRPLFGRVAACAQLDAAQGLTTITGPGGVGKTALIRHWQHGREGWFVELASARTADDILMALATAVGVRMGTVTVAELAVWFGDRPGVLVLDNLEGAASAAASIITALADRTTVICTSRVPLEVPGERLLELELLPADIGVQLLQDRAMRAGAHLDPEDVALLPELCERLEGLPLALELAAARLPLLSVRDLLILLQTEQQVLTAPEAVGPPRHLSLSAAVQWSWNLLSGSARTTLAAASAFAGVFDTASLREVLGDDPTDSLRALRNSSLVRPTEHGWSLYEAVRAFAARQAPAAPFRIRHAQWVSRSLQRGHREIFGPREAESVRALLALAPDHTRALQQDLDPDTRVDLLTSGIVALARGGFMEMRQARIREAMAVPGPLRPALEARRLRLFAVLHSDSRDHQSAQEILQRIPTRDTAWWLVWANDTTRARLPCAAQLRSVLAEAHGDPIDLVRIRIALGVALRNEEQLEDAAEQLSVALNQAMTLGSDVLMGNALLILAFIADSRGDAMTAAMLAQQASHHYARGEHWLNEAIAIANMAAHLTVAGRPHRAQRALQQAIEAADRIGYRASAAISRITCVALLIAGHKFDEARQDIAIAISTFEDMGDDHRLAQAEHLRGMLAVLEGDPRRGLVDLEHAAPRLWAVGTPTWRPANRAWIALAYRMLGESRSELLLDAPDAEVTALNALVRDEPADPTVLRRLGFAPDHPVWRW